MSANFAEAQSVIGANGSPVFVTSGGAYVNTRTEFDQAVIDGRAFSFASLTYDPDAHDTIFGIENNSTTHLLKIQKLIITSDAASLIQIFVTSGVTMTGTAIVGVNLNRTSGRTAGDVTAIADETDNGEQGSSYPSKLLHKQVDADVGIQLDLDGAIVLPSGWMMGIDLTTAATAANVTALAWLEPI